MITEDFFLLPTYILISFKLSRSLQFWWISYKQCKKFTIFLYPVKDIKLQEIFQPYILTLVTSLYLSGVFLYFGVFEIFKFSMCLIILLVDSILRFPEQNNILEYSNLNIGYGAALCYYKNYLTDVLPDKFVERIENFKAVNKVAVLNKLFILVPKSCKVPRYLESSESLKIERCRELNKHEQTHSGIVNRVYNMTVYLIRKNDDAKGVRLAVEYAPPLKGLYALKDKNKISDEEMFHHRELFVETLKNFLRDKNDCYKYCELIEYDDDKKTVVDVLFERCGATPCELL